MKCEKFPIVEAGHIFNPFNEKTRGEVILKKTSIEIQYPCRLDAMAINPAAVCYNDTMVFTPGEVVVSLEKFVKVKIIMNDEKGGVLNISATTKRKVLVKHAYLLMCKALNVNPSLNIDVDDNDIPKHCGFGSSSSTIAAVAAAINELYSCPIQNVDLIRYLASNHGEEVTDEDQNNLKVVQCIGGGATNGLTDEGVIIIAGKATTIAKMKYESDVLIGIPNDYVQKDAKVLMELEEKNLWKFKKTGEKYSEKIAYDLLHKALPGMINNSIRELAEIVFEYRFNMGSNENCSFVYDGLMDISDKIRYLYENKECEFLALSSVGPAFFAIVKDEKQKEKCIEYMKDIKLQVIESKICNTKYIISDSQNIECFWKKQDTINSFKIRPVSRYVTNVIDTLKLEHQKCVDIGCGSGRYSKYLKSKGADVLAVDKNPEMFCENDEINFVIGLMNDVPVMDNSYYLVLSIGVIHNAVTLNEYIAALKEIYRILKKDGKALISVFTDDLISNDLTKVEENKYTISNRPPMILLSKNKIHDYIKQIGFNEYQEIDEHVTDVGSGKRNVYTILIQK